MITRAETQSFYLAGSAMCAISALGAALKPALSFRTVGVAHCFRPSRILKEQRHTVYYRRLLCPVVPFASHRHISTTMSCIVLFRCDLRLHDNAVLAAAVGHATKEKRSLLPLYVVDPRQWGIGRMHTSMDAFGSRVSPLRARFIAESLTDLKHKLRHLGSDLLVRWCGVSPVAFCCILRRCPIMILALRCADL